MSDKFKMNQGLNIVVLVSGRGSNLQALIDAIQAKKIQSQIKMVISNKAGVQALERAESASIPYQVVLSKGNYKQAFQTQLLTTVKELNPDLIVLAGFMKILSPEFIKTFENQIINIHPALLPAFPGLNAQEQAMEAGVKVTGCTVHFVDEGCDTGPIILQKTEDVLDDDDSASLSRRLLKKEHASLVEAVKLIEENKVVLQGRKTLLRKES